MASHSAMKRALALGRKHPELIERLDILKFSYKKYEAALASHSALDRAIQKTLDLSRTDRHLLPCLQKDYTIYFKSMASHTAMDRAFSVCDE